jgi:predicted Zn finger-like uncharacterized protein
MKFVCDKCRTKYTIADEKVRGKVLKIRCKNCGNIIEVREPTVRPSAAARATNKPSTQGVLKAMSRHGGTRKRSSAVAKLTPGGLKTSGAGKSSPAIGARADRSRPTPAAQPRKKLDRPRSAGLAKQPRATPSKKPAGPGFDDEPKTVVAAMPEEMLRELRQGGPADAAPEPAAPADDDGGWFLGDDRGEYGPMTFAELASRCQRGEPASNAEAWKEGFDDWRVLEDIPALKPYLKVAPPPRPVADAKPAPASPYQKSPDKDAAVRAPWPVPKAPLPAKVTPAAPVDDSLVKIPAAVPAAEPEPPEDGWPELPSIQPADPTPRPMSAAAALAPEPFLPASVVAIPLAPAASPAHVSPGANQSALSPHLVDLKSDRRPILLIGAGVLLLSISVVVLVVYLISSGKKPSTSGATAEAGMSMQTPPMRAATAAPLTMEDMAAMPAPMDAEDTAELDLDIDVSTGKVSKTRRRRRRRSGRKSMEPMDAARAASSGNLYGLPTMREGFVGLMGFGSPSMRASSGSTGGRPGDLRSVIKRNYNRLRRCYEKAARINSRIRNPRLRITVHVRASGRASSVHVSPARHKSNTLGICIRRTIMSWRWPTFSTDYRWTFSARFSSG